MRWSMLFRGPETEEELDKFLDAVPRDDPEVRERGRWLVNKLLERYPEVRDEFIAKHFFTKGVGRVFVHQYERRLGRSLTAEEHHTLRERFKRLGGNRVGDVVLDLSSAEALAAWLADPNAV